MANIMEQYGLMIKVSYYIPQSQYILHSACCVRATTVGNLNILEYAVDQPPAIVN